jgi:hypothetical protein
VIDLDDSDVVITSHKRKKQKQNDQPNPDQVDDDDNSDDDIIAPTPSRRGSRKSPQKSGDTGSEEVPKTPRKYPQQDELDLEEDLEDLRDTGENIQSTELRMFTNSTIKLCERSVHAVQLSTLPGATVRNILKCYDAVVLARRIYRSPRQRMRKKMTMNLSNLRALRV